MPTVATIIIAKLILKASRVLGRGGGSALPGLVAEKLDPAIGGKLAKRIPHGSIIVTGTNGKTTTSKMLARILEDRGESLVQNRAGSNLSRGVVSALLEHSSWRGKFSQTMGLFEVDEAAMPAVAKIVKPRLIIVLNLFRDQLDRYGELDVTADLIGKGIAATEAKVLLNADDPLVASLAKYAHKPDEVEYFGVNELPLSAMSHDVTADSNTCPICGRALKYDKVFYGHIGHYHCEEGHFDRPQTAVSASEVKLGEDDSQLHLVTPSDEHSATLNLPGVYNIYNALAATAAAYELGIQLPLVSDSLHNVEAAFGRVEKLQIGNKQIYLLLVKNPTGFNQIIQTFLLQKKQQNILFLINDNFADGRDVSWLWDVALEELEHHHHTVDVGGIRATDMALRLKYTDIPVRSINREVKLALNQFIDQLPARSTGYIIPTYTAMLETRKRLGRKIKLAGVWK